MRKNLHHKIMLSILAGSLALGFVYAPPAFAEEDVTIADGETYNLDAEGTTAGTNYGDEKGYTSISLPTGPIGTFTVTAGKGGNIEISAYGEDYTGGNGGIVTLTFDKTVTGNINATGGKGGNIEISAYGENLTGGDGGDVTLTFDKTVTGNINATGGDGGNIEISAYGENLTGGNGGDSTLTFKNVVTNSIKLTSGSNGGNNYISTAFKGGSVTFEANTISGTTSTSDIAINLTKKDGDITFDVGTLNIVDNTVTITATGDINTGIEEGTTQNRKANHIDNLILTGNGDIDTTDANGIKIGQLTIDGGEINDTNWAGFIDRTYYNDDGVTENNNIALGENGVTFDITSDKTLAKNLTGNSTGNLTKTGTGTLILGKENENYTYDYEGLTVVKEGILDASISELTNSKGLTLFGGELLLPTPPTKIGLAQSKIGTTNNLSCTTTALTLRQFIPEI